MPCLDYCLLLPPCMQTDNANLISGGCSGFDHCISYEYSIDILSDTIKFYKYSLLAMVGLILMYL